MEDLITQFNLALPPEGGFFRETYRSGQQVWSDAASALRAAATPGTYTLSGCTVAPGFDFTDFCFVMDHPTDLERFNTLGSHLNTFL